MILAQLEQLVHKAILGLLEQPGHKDPRVHKVLLVILVQLVLLVHKARPDQLDPLDL